MKKILYFLILLSWPLGVWAKSSQLIGVHLFYSRNCQHCAAAKDFLQKYEKDGHPIQIYYYEVSYNLQNVETWERIQTVMNEISNSVPYVVIGTEIYIGFSSGIESEMRHAIAYYQTHEYVDIPQKIIEGKITETNIAKYMDLKPEGKVEVPGVGVINLQITILTILAVGGGILAGLNPNFKVTSNLLKNKVLSLKTKFKLKRISLLFSLISALIYFGGMILCFGLSTYGSRFVHASLWLGILTLIFAGLNGYFCFKSKDSSLKSKSFKKDWDSSTSFKTILGSLISVIILANLTLPTGFPLLFASLLAFNQLELRMVFILLFLYSGFFFGTNLIIFNKVKESKSKHIQISRLIGFLIMLTLGILIIIQPQWIIFNF